MANFQEVAAPSLLAAAQAAYQQGQYRLLAMFGSDERALHGHFAVYCLFDGPEHGFQMIKALVGDGEQPSFPSLALLIPAATWYEREIHDLFGIVPVGHPDLRPLVLHENWPQGQYPLRKDFRGAVDESLPKTVYHTPQVHGEGLYEVPVGPIHAGIIEPGHFRFSQAGENIINLEAKLFFTHRGIEKAVEGTPLSLAFYRAERICGACSVSHALSFSQAVENMAGVVVPRQAEYLRVLTAELERLYNHVGDIGNLCAGVGFAVGISHGARIKELLMRLNEMVTGNRFLRGMVIPGGVAMDITPALAREVESAMHILETDFREVVDLLRESAAFLNRVNGTGILPREAALDLGAVGVAARASGVDTDTRRDHPYGLYKELDFAVPVHTSGDVAARLWVRADEVEQSICIVRQVLEGIPGGLLKVDLPPIKPYTSAFGISESARGSNLHWLMVGEQQRIYRYFVRSASYCNWPAVTVATPGNIIPDFPLINKSFELCYACLDR